MIFGKGEVKMYKLTCTDFAACMTQQHTDGNQKRFWFHLAARIRSDQYITLESVKTYTYACIPSISAIRADSVRIICYPAIRNVGMLNHLIVT